MTFRALKLVVLAEQLAIARLEPDSTVPAWAEAGSFVSVTRTPNELSVVCSASSVPADVPSEGPYAGIQVCGPLEFSEIGILASIALPLSEANVSLLSLSTFETDFVLVAQDDLDRALDALESVGHKIVNLALELS